MYIFIYQTTLNSSYIQNDNKNYPIYNIAELIKNSQKEKLINNDHVNISLNLQKLQFINNQNVIETLNHEKYEPDYTEKQKYILLFNTKFDGKTAKFFSSFIIENFDKTYLCKTILSLIGIFLIFKRYKTFSLL